MQDLRIESIDLEITTKCNLACAYCYIGCGDLEHVDMSDETIEKVFQLIKMFGSRNKAVHIDFYGGEPLVSFERVKYVVEEAKKRKLNINFSLLSNGTVGTQEQFDYLEANRIWIQRSIDGHAEAQEKYRTNSINKYLEVAKVIRDFTESRRMTIRPEFAKDLLKSLYWFEEHGYSKGLSPMPDFYTEWTDEQIKDFQKSLWDLGRYYVKRWKKNDPFYCYYFSEEINGRYMNRKKFGCGGAMGLHSVSVDGYLYVCHRFSKTPKDGPFCFGSLDEVLTAQAKGYGEEVIKRVNCSRKDCEDNWNEECRYCIAQKGCEKGCMHTNWMCTKTLNTPPKLYCRIRQEAAKVVDWIDEQLRDKDRYWWGKGNTAKGATAYVRNLERRQQNQQQCNTPQQGNSVWCQEFVDGTRNILRS